MPSSIKPSIGRKVWYWQVSGAGVIDNAQAFDATVVFVHPDGLVNLNVRDHSGYSHKVANVELHDPADGSVGREEDAHGKGNYATWMPYQVGQAKAAEVPKTSQKL
jgi:hypothetical protein